MAFVHLCPYPLPFRKRVMFGSPHIVIVRVVSQDTSGVNVFIYFV